MSKTVGNGLAAIALSATIALLAVGCGDDDCQSLPDDGLGEPTAWERELLDAENWPSPPTPQFLAGEEEVPLAYRTSTAEDVADEETVVLFVHGSSTHSGAYTILGEGLSERGVHARFVDLRGHGLSVCRPDGNCEDPASIQRTYGDDGVYYPGRPGDSRDKNQLVRDLSRHIEDVRTNHAEARLLVAGHSSGAGLVLRFLERGGLEQVDGVALLSPFYHPDQPQSSMQEFECGRKQSGNGYAVVDLGALGAALRGEVHRYVLSFRKGDAYEQPLDTLQNTYTTMTGMQTSSADDFAAAISTPVLWVAAREDALLDLEIQRREFEKLPEGGHFVVAEQTSHVGLGWSDGVAELLADWATEPDSVTVESIEPQ